MPPEGHPNEPEKRALEDHPVHAYARALRALDAAAVPYLVGGGLALAQYGRRRATKDLDIFLSPDAAERAMNALSAAGFTTLDSDATWLRKAQMDDVFIDLILYSMGRIGLTPEEVGRGLHVVVEGVPMRIFAPEDLLLRKAYVLREGGPDWNDAYSIIETRGSDLDWNLLHRNGLDPRIMAAFLLTADAALPGKIPPAVLERYLAAVHDVVRDRLLTPDGSPAPGREPALPPTTGGRPSEPGL
jgi:hypothetical protein